MSGGQARGPTVGAEVKTRPRGCNNTDSSFGNRGPSPSNRKETRRGVTSFLTGESLRGEADQRSTILPVHRQSQKACFDHSL